jgi:luciferase family oxidoreductase group 1
MSPPKPLPLSILDLVPLANGMTSAQALAHSLDLARHADALGYTRLWYAEHHNMPAIASTTPEIMITRAAMVTSRLRLGAGGVMLPNHSPLKVAETYRLLEAMAPGRIDLGLGRAPGTDPTTALALRRSREAVYADDFPAQLGELLAFGGEREFPKGHPFAGVKAQPDDAPLPPVWLLGSSDYSAHLAAQIGHGFAFAAHFSPTSPEGPMLDYRRRFRPGAIERPHAILALSVFCAPTAEEAELMAIPTLVAFARLRTGRPSRLLNADEARTYRFTPSEAAAVEGIRAVQIIGTPVAVKARIDELVALTEADEVMVAMFAAEHSERLRSFELLAEAYGLPKSERATREVAAPSQDR